MCRADGVGDNVARVCDAVAGVDRDCIVQRVDVFRGLVVIRHEVT